jgi:diguanylate cyclase (GGDEF)-like protein/PAS domain S-box-containing protein
MTKKPILHLSPEVFSILNEQFRIVIENVSDAVWMSDFQFRVSWVSPSVVRMRGFSLEETQAMPIQKQVTPGSYKVIQSILKNDLTPRQLQDRTYQFTRTLELEFYRKDASSYWSEVTVTLLRDQNGEPTGLLGIGRDITERRHYEERLAASEQRYRSLFESFPIGMYRTLPDGRIIEVNNALVDMLKYPGRESLLQKNANDLYVNPNDRQRQQTVLLVKGKLLQSEVELHCFDGSTIVVRDNVHMVPGSDETVYLEGSLEDITNEKQAEAALKYSEERYRNLVENMGEGLTFVDPREIVLFSNPAADDMFGVPAGELIGRDLQDFLETNQLMTVLEQTSKRKKGTRSVYEVEIRRPDGERRNLMITATPQYNDEKRFIGAFGVIHDITIRRKNEQALRKTQAQLAGKVQELEQRQFEISKLAEMGNIFQKSTKIEETYSTIAEYSRVLFPDTSGILFSMDTEKGAGHILSSWGKPAFTQNLIGLANCKALQLHQPYFATGSANSEFCSHVKLLPAHPSSSLCIPINNQDQVVGMLHIQTRKNHSPLSEAQLELANAEVEQISLAFSNLILRERLSEQAIRDPLTGLFNRYYMEETLEMEVERSRRNNKPIGIIMLDFDGFKELNTIFGHPTVDEMLREFGRLLSSAIRSSDVSCRYGGDEFLIILPETNLETTCHRAEELRLRVKNLRVHKQEKTMRVSISLGVAAFPDHGHSIAELIQAADAALLKAKQQHDCSVIAMK